MWLKICWAVNGFRIFGEIMRGEVLIFHNKHTVYYREKNMLTLVCYIIMTLYINNYEEF